MLVCLARDSFVRSFGDVGYITNQLTRQDRVYDVNGRVFLERLGRRPKTVEAVVGELAGVYPFAGSEELERDFVEFAGGLEREGYVVSGRTEREVAAKMPAFSYTIADGKTRPRTEYDLQHPARSTADFFQSLFRKRPQIFSFQIELTSRCNERCRHCYLPGPRPLHDLETPLVMDVLDQLAEMGTLGLTLSGGECLLHRDFIPILRHARERDFSISVLSNVTLLTDELLEALRDANLNLLQVSVYSMDPSEHDWVTQLPGSHARTIQAIERLIAADVPVQISCPTMKKTYKSYPRVLEWAYEHRIKGYTDFIMMARTDHSTDNLDNRLSFEETEALLKGILDVDVEYKALLESAEDFTVDEDLASQPVCGAGTDSMCMAANGDFYPCSGFQGYPLGNAYHQTVRDVWENSEAIQRLRAIRWSEFQQCLTCEAKPFCAMCMVRNFNETGDIFSVSRHFCDVAFLNKRLAEEYRLRHRSQCPV